MRGGLLERALLPHIFHLLQTVSMPPREVKKQFVEKGV